MSEKVVVGLQGESYGLGEGASVVLEDDVVLEPACSVQGVVGKGSCVEAGARVGRGAAVGEVSFPFPKWVLCMILGADVNE